MEKLRAPLPGEAAEGLEVQGQDLRGLLLLGKPQGPRSLSTPRAKPAALGKRAPSYRPPPRRGRPNPGV